MIYVSDDIRAAAVLESKERVTIGVNWLDYAAYEQLAGLLFKAILMNLRLSCCYCVA